MNAQWPCLELEQLTEEDRPITYGVVKPGDNVYEGIKFVRGSDVFQGRIALNELRTISPQLSQVYKRTVLKGGELLISLVGNPGEVAVVPPSLEGANIARQVGMVALRPDVEVHFVMYYLMSTEGRAELFTRTGGAVQQVINLADLKTVKIPVPPISQQRQIVETLSSYDDLIENNRRRMELLEDAARQLYREWFVRLRFPGREHTRIINGVPEGWKRKALAELCASVDYGYTASAEEEEVGPKFVRITDIVPEFINWGTVPHCQIQDDRLEKFRLREGDIVIARTGATVGYAKRLHKRHPDAVFASYLVRLRLNPDVDNLFVGVFVESEDYKDYVKSRVGGAAQPNANAKVLAGAEILVSPPILQRAFREFVEPLVDQRELLQIQNEKLRVVRDLLLPRLMSGEIAV